MKSIGGNDNYRVVIGILKKVLSNEVAEQYSLAGAKKKRCFKDLILYKVLLGLVIFIFTFKFLICFDKCNILNNLFTEAVRCHRNSITEVEFAELVSRWLVQAKLRKERAEE